MLMFLRLGGGQLGFGVQSATPLRSHLPVCGFHQETEANCT